MTVPSVVLLIAAPLLLSSCAPLLIGGLIAEDIHLSNQQWEQQQRWEREHRQWGRHR